MEFEHLNSKRVIEGLVQENACTPSTCQPSDLLS
jgi:hypothetical protein